MGELSCISGENTCQPHYLLVFGKCLAQCKVNNCDQCANVWVNNCTVCKSGYALSEDRTFCRATRNLQQVELPEPLDAKALIASLDK